MADDLNENWQKRFGYTFKEFAKRNGTTEEELVKQSLQHAEKAGTKPISGFFDMAEKVRGSGLKVLNAPNTDLENITCLAASGCNVTIFTTGRGTVCGSPTSITLKVTATEKTADRMSENIDVSVHEFTNGEDGLESAASRLVDRIISTANGNQTAAEKFGHYEVAIPIKGVTY